jgi:hypothetical protein
MADVLAVVTHVHPKAGQEDAVQALLRSLTD